MASGQVNSDNHVVDASHESSAPLKRGESAEVKNPSPPSLPQSTDEVSEGGSSTKGKQKDSPQSAEGAVCEAKPEVGGAKVGVALGSSETPGKGGDINVRPESGSRPSDCEQITTHQSSKKSEQDSIAHATVEVKKLPGKAKTPSPPVRSPAPRENSQDGRSGGDQPSDLQPSKARGLLAPDKPVLVVELKSSKGSSMLSGGEESLADDSISPTSNLVMDVSFISASEPTPSAIISPEEPMEVGNKGRTEQEEEHMDTEDIPLDGPVRDELVKTGKVSPDLPGGSKKEKERKETEPVAPKPVTAEEAADGSSSTAEEGIATKSASDGEEISCKSSLGHTPNVARAISPNAETISTDSVNVNPVLRDSALKIYQTETKESTKSSSTYAKQGPASSVYSGSKPSIVSEVAKSTLVSSVTEQPKKSTTVSLGPEKPPAPPSLGVIQKASKEVPGRRKPSTNRASVFVNRVDGSKLAAVSSVVPPAVKLSQLGVQVDAPQSVVISCMEISSVAPMAAGSYDSSHPASSRCDGGGAELVVKSSTSSIPIPLSSAQVSIPVPIVHDLLSSSSGPVAAFVSLSTSSSAAAASSGPLSSQAPPTSSTAKFSLSTAGSESSDKSDARLVKVDPGALAMPALTAVAPTVLTAATPIIATPTTSSRQTSTTSKKPVLSAGLSPTLSSNLAALFPSQAGKFAVPGSYAASVASSSVSAEGASSLVKAQQNAARHPVVVTPAKVAAGKAVMVTPMLSASMKGEVLSVVKPPCNSTGKTSAVSSGAEGILKTVPVIAKSSGLKGGLVPTQGGGAAIVIDPSAITSSTVAKLKAEQALALHGGNAIQQVNLDGKVISPNKQTVGIQGFSFDFTNFVMPMVIDVLRVGSAVKLGTKKAGKGKDLANNVVPIMRMLNPAVSGLGKEAGSIFFNCPFNE